LSFVLSLSPTLSGTFPIFEQAILTRRQDFPELQDLVASDLLDVDDQAANPNFLIIVEVLLA
jgi:hypothetical protein